jgi:hypothetical protein
MGVTFGLSIVIQNALLQLFSAGPRSPTPARRPPTACRSAQASCWGRCRW